MTRLLTTAVLALALIGAAPLALWGWVQAEGNTLTGLRVEGALLSPTADPTGGLRARADRWLDTAMVVRAGPVVVSTTRREVGARVDTEAMAADLLRVGRSGSVVRDLRSWYLTRRGDTNVPFPVRIDRATTAAFLASLQARVDREPVEGQVDAAGRLTAPPAPGARLQVIDADAALSAALQQRETAVDLPVEELAAPRMAAPEPRRRFAVVLASYTTRFSPRGNRGHNVRHAAELLDGAVIEPGGQLSFNGRVGPRTTAAGFRRAHEIQSGEMVDGIGGGTCQVASTLHAAAFLAGFTMVDHSPHSRPSDYIPLGLDATVVWPSVDLVLHNPYAFPVRVEAVTEERQLSIALLGSRAPPRVSWQRQVLSRLSPGERMIEDPDVPMGTTEVSQQALPGFIVRRTRVIDDGMRAVTEERVLRYPATDRVVRIPVKEGEG